ncbi:hypothetical protein ACHAXR_010800 [Thalassiosira sp. AJA248-18]
MVATPRGKGHNMIPLSAPPTKTLVGQFTKRDLILYALGIGCCSDGYNDADSDGRFVYEHHPNFEAFPTFLLALSFVAEQQSDLQSTSKLGFGIRPFPPDSMANYLEDGSNGGILPKEFFKNQEDIAEMQGLPILHMSQSLVLHDKIKPNTDKNIYDPPTQVQLQTQILSVKPRSIGTFLKSETKYYQGGICIATAQMTALVLGLDPEKVVPWEAHDARQVNKPASSSYDSPSGNTNECKEKTILEYRIPKNAALVYRLSGDYNPIHVEDNNILGSDDQHDEGNDGKLEQKQKSGPVLHGLCTMGYALRAVLHHMHQSHHGDEIRLASVQCNFVKPVYVGDSLRVEVWNVKDDMSRENTVFNVCFRVYRDIEKQSDVVVDKGKAQFCLKKFGTDVVTLSRL